ncbi:MAG TPA: type I methionyl aminopeptidase [Candidatus Paceibacterota bacterium]
MIQLKTEQDIKTLREAGAILGRILTELEKATVGGVSSLELENLARKLTAEAGAVPAFLGYKPYGADRPFPAALCLSVNDAVVHGIPNEKPFTINDGDIVVLDMGITYKGRVVDSAITVSAGGPDKTDEKGRKLLQAGKEALDAAIEACKNWKTDFPNGIKTGDVGHAIDKAFSYYHQTYGFNMAEYLGGHGVGFSVHEDPFIPNYGKPGQGPVLKPGAVIAIEPIINEKSGETYLDSDGYTLRTTDRRRSVHFEHTIAITEDGAEVLTVR